MRNGKSIYHGINLFTHYEKSYIYPQEQMQAQESHQNASTSCFHILWSTMKADKSLYNFTEVLPFSAWPADLIFLYITLTSTVFFIQIPPICYKENIWKDCWKFNLSLQFCKVFSKNQGWGRESRWNDEHKRGLSVRHSFPYHSLHEAGLCRKRWCQIILYFNFHKLNRIKIRINQCCTSNCTHPFMWMNSPIRLSERDAMYFGGHLQLP